MKSAPASIRAKRFEIVGPSGKILSYWGPDSDPQIPAATPKGVLLVFMDPNGVRRCQVGAGVGNYSPELQFYGKDGPSETKPQQYLPHPRFSIGLGYNDDPGLAMRDQSVERIVLGAVHGDAPGPSEDTWCLSLREPVTTLVRSRASLCAYRALDGTHGAETLIIDRDRRWSLPPQHPAQ